MRHKTATVVKNIQTHTQTHTYLQMKCQNSYQISISWWTVVSHCPQETKWNTFHPQQLISYQSHALLIPLRYSFTLLSIRCENEGLHACMHILLV